MRKDFSVLHSHSAVQHQGQGQASVHYRYEEPELPRISRKFSHRATTSAPSLWDQRLLYLQRFAIACLSAISARMFVSVSDNQARYSCENREFILHHLFRRRRSADNQYYRLVSVHGRYQSLDKLTHQPLLSVRGFIKLHTCITEPNLR